MKRKPWRDERILFNRMRDEEQSYILEILNHWEDSPESITFIEHSMDRLYQKYIYEDEVIETIKHGTIIELHIVNNSPRLLFRKQRSNQAKDICVVMDVLSGKVVTAFTNDSNDNHSTLREEIYNDELDVITIIQECIKRRK